MQALAVLMGKMITREDEKQTLHIAPKWGWSVEGHVIGYDIKYMQFYKSGQSSEDKRIAR